MSRYIGHYRIIDKLGEGAMGAVYKGMDDNLQMPVAIKVMNPALANDPEVFTRFEREARAAANLRHQHIAHVFFTGRHRNVPFYAMEFIDGQPLQKIIADRRILSGETIVGFLTQTADALALAAKHGVLHRDIKPGNLMVTKDGDIKIVDFGLVKHVGGDSQLTQTGVAMGTPNYLSPEMGRGNEPDHRSDMYSLGVTMFELVTGNLPFSADSPIAVIMQHVQAPIPDLEKVNKQYPPAVRRVIEKVIAKDPEDRYDTYEAFIQALHGLAVEAPDFMAAQWGYCNHEKANVIVKEGQCTLCRRQVTELEKTVTHYDVYLSAITEPEQRAKLVAYLADTTKKPVAEMEQLVAKLPLLLARRLPEDTAKQLQKKMFALGGEISLKLIQERAKITRSAEEAAFTVRKSTRPAAPAATLAGRTAAMTGNTTMLGTAPPPWVLYAGLGAAVLALILVAWAIVGRPRQTGGTVDEASMARVARMAAESVREQAAQELPDYKAAVPVDYTLSPGERVRVGNIDGRAETTEAVARAADGLLADMESKVGLQARGRVTVMLENRRSVSPSRPMLDYLPVTLEGEGVFSPLGKTPSVEDAQRFQVAYQLAFALLNDEHGRSAAAGGGAERIAGMDELAAGGDTGAAAEPAPGEKPAMCRWFQLGLATALAAEVAGGGPDFADVLKRHTTYSLEALDGAIAKAGAGAAAQAAVLARWIVRARGVKSALDDFTGGLACADEGAFTRRYGTSPREVLAGN